MSSKIKFIASLPAAQRGRGSSIVADIVTELSARPGTWAEVERRGKSRASALSSRAQHLRSQPNVEAATRVDGDEVVLYARVVAA